MAISATAGGTVNNATAGTSLAFTAGTLTNGQLVVVAVAILVTTVSVSGISDTVNTYTFQSAIDSGTGVRVELWTAPVTTATASRTITVTLNGSSLASAAYEEYAGATSGVGNIGTAVAGSSFYPEADAATQDGNNWGIAAIAVASSSGDTFTADLGTIRQSLVPALTTAGVALVDNTAQYLATMRNAVRLSASRTWAAAGLELRTGGAAINVTAAPLMAPIVKPPLHSTPVPVCSALAGGTTGVSYSQTISAQAGTAPYTFTVTSGALPTSLSLNASTGVISGTPSAVGTFTFSIRATMTNGGFVGNQAFSIIIAAPTVVGGNSGFVA